MVTSKKLFKLSGKNLDLEDFKKDIFEAGTFFSGSVEYGGYDVKNAIVFSFVNQANIAYILHAIDKDQEVTLEIFAHANYSEELQRQDCWET